MDRHRRRGRGGDGIRVPLPLALPLLAVAGIALAGCGGDDDVLRVYSGRHYGIEAAIGSTWDLRPRAIIEYLDLLRRVFTEDEIRLYARKPQSLAARFAGKEGMARFTPALVRTWPNMRTFAFVVEEHADGNTLQQVQAALSWRGHQVKLSVGDTPSASLLDDFSGSGKGKRTGGRFFFVVGGGG